MMNELVIVNYERGYYQIYNKEGQLYENRKEGHSFITIPHADKEAYLEVDTKSDTIQEISFDHPHKLTNTFSSQDIVM